jgi:hypothetical protein
MMNISGLKVYKQLTKIVILEAQVSDLDVGNVK